mmetsp:Transcript_117337/g.373850  ORF Transcript_117337/g.373850 Transcript_117337/m.373850 type:complete len:302 (-) Transcript_117337:175-1080(-)
MPSTRRAIVTGASRGIGRAIAVRLARAGWQVALFGRDAEALGETAAACIAAASVDEGAPGGEPTAAEAPPAKRPRTAASGDAVAAAAAEGAAAGEGAATGSVFEEGGRFPTVLVDMRDRERVREAVDRAAARLGGLEALVCNAAVLLAASAVDGDPARWEEELDVNVKGSMAATRYALPHILRSQASSRAVIFIGSTASQWSFPWCGGYCASKHALKGFAGSVFSEVRDKGVKVTLIMPGFTDTDMVAANKGMIKDKMIQPDDIAHAVEFVLSFPSSACPTEMLIRPQYDCTDGTVPYTIV